VPGWASIVAIICFLGGVQIMMIGIVGLYISRIYTEALDRPLYTVDFDLFKGGEALYTGTLKNQAAAHVNEESNDEIMIRVEAFQIQKKKEIFANLS
ncbi:MAG: hypothetical protein ACRCXZ_03670, partial [Patescibacteria group bacterium]